MKKFIAALSLFSSIAFAKASVEVKNSYIRLPPPGSTTSAMFGEFINNEKSDRKIIKVTGATISDDFELHEMNMDNGKMSMRKVESITLPKQAKAILRPGGLHIMIFNLKRALKENEAIDLEFTFDNQEKLQTKITVKK